MKHRIRRLLGVVLLWMCMHVHVSAMFLVVCWDECIYMHTSEADELIGPTPVAMMGWEVEKCA